MENKTQINTGVRQSPLAKLGLKVANAILPKNFQIVQTDKNSSILFDRYAKTQLMGSQKLVANDYATKLHLMHLLANEMMDIHNH